MIQDRRSQIIALVTERQEVSVEELALALAVSRETVRRDLVALHDEGRLRKFHGGARAMAPVESPYPLRLIQNVTAKTRIAARAVQGFAPGDSLFIDAGTTTLLFAEALASVGGLTVVTNGLRIAEALAAHRTNRVFLLGGALNAEVGETLGPLVQEQVAKFRAGTAVLTVGALGPEGVMDYDLHEAEIARAMIARADRVVILADATKFDRKAVFDVAPLSALSRLITDTAPDPLLQDALKEAEVEVILA